MTNYSRSVLKSNGQIRGENLRNGTLPGAKIHPQRLGFPSPEQDSPGPFTRRPQTPQRSFRGAATGTHLPSPTGSHTAAYTAKQGRFRWGRYYYPRSVSHVSETLRGQGVERQTLPLLGLGRVCSRRTQKAFGTAMRLCASLFRGVAAPLGCVIFSVSVEIAVCMPCAQGLSVCARRGVVSLPSARFTCC